MQNLGGETFLEKFRCIILKQQEKVFFETVRVFFSDHLLRFSYHIKSIFSGAISFCRGAAPLGCVNSSPTRFPKIFRKSQGAAKIGRQKEFDHFFPFLVTFWSLSLTLLSLFSSLFCQTPFAGLGKVIFGRIQFGNSTNPCFFRHCPFFFHKSKGWRFIGVLCGAL